MLEAPYVHDIGNIVMSDWKEIEESNICQVSFTFESEESSVAKDRKGFSDICL